MRAPRQHLGNLLIQSDAALSEATLDAVDKVLQAEKLAAASAGDEPLLVTREGLPGARWLSRGQGSNSSNSSLQGNDGSQTGQTQPHGPDVCVWRGDIRRLRVGACVNTANERGLGCFQPGHLCIDNVLHRAAGPRLRAQCRQLMASGRPEGLRPGGPPILTLGYQLHADHVLHVTGPTIVPPGRTPTAEEAATLASCYTGCLRAACEAQLESVAFCCISTGLFGYPSDAAAACAVDAVLRWLEAEPELACTLKVIVFDIFTEADEVAYARYVPY